MNRYEQIMACAQIREFVQKKQYRNALNLMDSIDLRHFRSRGDQLDFIEVFLHTMRYEDARELLLPLYDVYPTCHVVYDLFLVSIKLHELEDAAEYQEEYAQMAPRDPERLIMEYMLARDSGASREDLILILKKLKQEEYTAEWGYELAKLYHKEGRKEECLQECSDLIVWFGKGKIVNKAITLQQLYLGTATLPLDEIKQAIQDKEEEADKLVEEVTRVCRDLYEEVSAAEESEKNKNYEKIEYGEKEQEEKKNKEKNYRETENKEKNYKEKENKERDYRETENKEKNYKEKENEEKDYSEKEDTGKNYKENKEKNDKEKRQKKKKYGEKKYAEKKDTGMEKAAAAEAKN
jgi:hypothetical protein